MELYILDRDFRTVAIADSYISVIWTDRFWECGDFEIKVPASKENLNIFKEDYYLWRKDSEHMMIIEDISTDSDVEIGNTLLITGRSLESILDRRIIWNQTTISGNLQSSIKKLLEENAISPSDSSRKIDILSFKESTDSKVTGLTADSQYTGDNLYNVICDLCKTAKIGFKITMPIDGLFIFELYAGADRSYDQTENPYVIFSPNYENLMNSSAYVSKREYKTVALVGGEGEGSDRVMTTVTVDGGSGSGLNRREIFTDARDVSRTVNGQEISDSEYRNQLQQRGKEDLAEYEITKTFDGQAELSRSFTYNVDFKMGDIVQNENEYGQSFTSRITEYIWSQDDSEIKEYPTFSVIEEEEGGNE